MFNFFFKKKKIVLDCFTDKQHVYDYAKIDHGNRFIPEWWKNTETLCKTEYEQDLTIKSCSAFTKLYEKSIIIPSWTALEIKVKSIKERQYEWLSSSTTQRNLPHHVTQFEKFALNDGVSFKLENPWLFKTKQKIYFLWSQPTWSMRKDLFNFSVLPGAIQFYNQPFANINLFLTYRDDPITINIEPLQPLVMLHPLTENEIEIKTHLVPEKKYFSLHYGMSEMTLIYKRHLNTNNLVKFRKDREKILNHLENSDGK